MVAPGFARTTVRTASSSMIPCGLRCSVHFLTNGGDDEKNNCINSVNCAGVRNCRGAVHFVPVGLCSSGRGIYGHCEQFMPIGLYVRRHSHQLYRVQPRWVMHYVRPCGCIVYRRHWDIRIHRGVCYGIGCSCWPRVRAGYIIPHPPSCSARPPRHTGGGGHSGVVPFGNMLSMIVTTPALRATPPQSGTWPSSRRRISSPPLEGCPNTGPRATCRVGG